MIVLLGLSIFVFLKFYTIQNGKIISLAEYNQTILNDELMKNAQSGDVEKEVQIAEQLVSSNNDNQSKIDLANAYLEKASLEFKEVEYGNKAIAIANEVLANSPDKNQEYQADLVLGYSYEVLQNYSKALEQYNKAIALYPDSPLGYVKRGHAYDLSGDLTSAEADYIKAYSIDSKNDVALMNLARIAQGKGDFENAKKYAQAAIDVTQIAYVKATAYEIFGLAEIDSGNYQIAIDDFSKSIDSYDKYGNAYANRAYAKILLNDYVVKNESLKNQIDQDIEKAVSFYGNDSFAYVVKGLLLEATGDKSKAKEAYNKALSLVDTDITLGMLEKSDMKAKINQSIINLGNNK